MIICKNQWATHSRVTMLKDVMYAQQVSSLHAQLYNSVHELFITLDCEELLLPKKKGGGGGGGGGGDWSRVSKNGGGGGGVLMIVRSRVGLKGGMCPSCADHAS